MEPLGEHRLQHGGDLLFSSAFGKFGENVEGGGGHPVGGGELIGLDSVRCDDQAR